MPPHRTRADKGEGRPKIPSPIPLQAFAASPPAVEPLSALASSGVRPHSPLYDLARQLSVWPRLRQTVVAYVESGFNMTLAAAGMCYHPNSIRHNLYALEDRMARQLQPADYLHLYLMIKMDEVGPVDRDDAIEVEVGGVTMVIRARRD